MVAVMTGVLLLFKPVTMLADDMVNALVVLTKDNAKHRFELGADRPEVTFDGTDLKVTCARASLTTSFKVSDVIRFTYEKVEATSVTDARDERPDIRYDGGAIVISDLKAGAGVAVYTADGRLVQQLKATKSGNYSLPLTQLPAGVYLVKADNVTYKITRQ